MSYGKQFFILFCFSLLYVVRSSCPSRVYAYGVSQREKDEIVAKHNHLRKLVQDGKLPNQPRGINLKRMKWDESLAKAAQEIANTCVYRHQAVNDGRFAVGQNLFMRTSTSFSKPKWDMAIQDWFDEYKMYKYPDKSSCATGHYTQVVWADTHLVGCGLMSYPNDDRNGPAGGYPYAQFYVCNYGPAGNYPTAPYKRG